MRRQDTLATRTHGPGAERKKAHEEKGGRWRVGRASHRPCHHVHTSHAGAKAVRLPHGAKARYDGIVAANDGTT